VRIYQTNPEHEVAFQELCDLVRKHSEDLSALEVLAVAANVVGKLVAMQDQRTTTPEVAMEIVARNIELGNEQVLQHLQDVKGVLR
jgi:hypothetical protein